MEVKIEFKNINGNFINFVSTPSWRFVYKGGNVIISPFYSDGITETMWNIFASDKEVECIEKIKELNLILPEENKIDSTVNNFLPEPPGPPLPPSQNLL